MRTFSLAQPNFAVPTAVEMRWQWAGLVDHDVATQLGFQEQFLHFHRYLLENLQSNSVDHPDWNPVPLSLSLRAGAIKAHVIFAVAIIEGALAALGVVHGIAANADALYDRTFGQLLRAWEVNGEPRAAIAPVWGDLQMLKTYRNYVHLARAANEEAYWQDIVEREQLLLHAVDRVLEFLIGQCHAFRDG